MKMSDLNQENTRGLVETLRELGYYVTLIEVDKYGRAETIRVEPVTTFHPHLVEVDNQWIVEEYAQNLLTRDAMGEVAIAMSQAQLAISWLENARYRKLANFVEDNATVV